VRVLLETKPFEEVRNLQHRGDLTEFGTTGHGELVDRRRRQHRTTDKRKDRANPKSLVLLRRQLAPQIPREGSQKIRRAAGTWG